MIRGRHACLTLILPGKALSSPPPTVLALPRKKKIRPKIIQNRIDSQRRSPAAAGGTEEHGGLPERGGSLAKGSRDIRHPPLDGNPLAARAAGPEGGPHDDEERGVSERVSLRASLRTWPCAEPCGPPRADSAPPRSFAGPWRKTCFRSRCFRRSRYVFWAFSRVQQLHFDVSNPASSARQRLSGVLRTQRCPWMASKAIGRGWPGSTLPSSGGKRKRRRSSPRFFVERCVSPLHSGRASRLPQVF